MSDALSVEAAPASLYHREASAFARRFRVAQLVTDAIQVAFGHADRLPVRPGRAEFEAHQHDVQEFAGLARKALAVNPAWQPNGVFMRWLWGRGVQVAEVMELLETARKEAA